MMDYVTQYSHVATAYEPETIGELRLTIKAIAILAKQAVDFPGTDHGTAALRDIQQLAMEALR